MQPFKDFIFGTGTERGKKGERDREREGEVRRDGKREREEGERERKIEKEGERGRES